MWLYLKGLGLTIDVPGGKTYSWRGFPSTSLRRGDWKLVEFLEDNTVGLYNLKDDPGEQHNRAQPAESMPELAAGLRTQLDAWQAETAAPIPAEPNPECILPPRDIGQRP